jgi:glycosyltransferase involved in cell wall biosynthesis
MKPALHIVSLPHTSTTFEYSWCAYTMKALKLARMMEKLDYKVYLYASTESIFENTIPCVMGPPTAQVTEPEWTPKYFEAMNNKAIFEMKKIIQPKDLILLTTGIPQLAIAQAFPDNMCVEYGVGYEGTISPFKVFESYAWMHTSYGYRGAHQPGINSMNLQGNWYDCVIPNYFEIDQFPEGNGSGDYLFYIGRLIELKGVNIAVETAHRTGLQLVVAGQGVPPEGCQYKGVVGPEERSALMGNARAVLVPSLYLEPFGGVCVESQICGTPVITTDWGAFPETVEQGKTGFRCRTPAEFDTAVTDVLTLDRKYIRERAIAKYSTDAIAPLYDTYFQRLIDLYEGVGFNATAR